MYVLPQEQQEGHRQRVRGLSGKSGLGGARAAMLDSMRILGVLDARTTRSAIDALSVEAEPTWALHGVEGVTTRPCASLSGYVELRLAGNEDE